MGAVVQRKQGAVLGRPRAVNQDKLGLNWPGRARPGAGLFGTME